MGNPLHKKVAQGPMQNISGEKSKRIKGTPQGGVISPVLANLFLHYCFDRWVSKGFPTNPWCRYADNALIHCVSEKQARYIKDMLTKRIKECELELNQDKTKIAYCKDSNRNKKYANISFTFLGYTFKPRKAKGKNGQVFTSFIPAISLRAKSDILKRIRKWRLLWRTDKTIVQLAEQLNPVIRGWLNYYGRYGKRELTGVLEKINYHLMLWAQRKYKRYKHAPAKAYRYLTRIYKETPNIFAHWEVGISP